MFITETHFPRSTRTSTPVLKYVKEKLDIDNVVFGGDVVDWNPTKEEAAAVVKEYFDELYAIAGSDLIWVHGNHDCNSAAMSA
ncbi:MAG: metallophosphoesterase [Bacteroidales bacterium]|nr:metallophosphoesterase [Bacteroidales bacterium]